MATIRVSKNEATSARRYVYFYLVDATDGITPRTGEAGGQPQISVDGAAWTNTGIGVLTHIGSGTYYAELTQAITNVDRAVIRTRYKSANTAETPGDTVQIGLSVTEIDGALTNGNNATLNLKQINVVNSAGDAFVASSTGGNGHGIHASGNGTGHGVRGVGGASSGNGIYGLSGAGGVGIDGRGNVGIRGIGAAGTNGPGIAAYGDGSGHGVQSTGGATGHGVAIIGGATSGDGINTTASGGGYGIRTVGVGSNAGFRAVGGATGDGIQGIGGVTSGAGAAFQAQGGGHGLTLNAVGGYHGLNSIGGATGHGALLTGGATSGDGLRSAASGGGHGFSALGTGADGYGFRGVGAGTGPGMGLTGGTTASGLYAAGGATSGNGIYGYAQAGNGSGIAGTGQGTGAGAHLQGGATGNGLRGYGGATSGAGIVAWAQGGNSAAIDATGNGTGAGLSATGGSTSGAGISAVGSGNGRGIYAAGNGTGSGIYAFANGTGHGLAGIANSGGSGAMFTGNGAGHGLYAIGGATGTGFRAEAGATSGYGIVAQGTSFGDGFRSLGGATGSGIYALGGATSGDGMRSVAQMSGSGIVASGVGGNKHGIDATAANTGGAGIKAFGVTYGLWGVASVGSGIVADAGSAGDGLKATTTAGVPIRGNLYGTVTSVTDPSLIADAVWDENISEHTGTGKAGAYLYYIYDSIVNTGVRIKDTIAGALVGGSFASGAFDAIRGVLGMSTNNLDTQISGIQTTVDGISNVTRISTSLPRFIGIPEPADSPKAILVEVAYKNSNGDMHDPDNNELVVSMYSADGNPNYDTYLYSDVTLQNQLPLDLVTGMRVMARDGIGMYHYYMKVEDTFTEEEITAKFSWVEETKRLYEMRDSQVADFNGELGQIYQAVNAVPGAVWQEELSPGETADWYLRAAYVKTTDIEDAVGEVVPGVERQGGMLQTIKGTIDWIESKVPSDPDVLPSKADVEAAPWQLEAENSLMYAIYNDTQRVVGKLPSDPDTIPSSGDVAAAVWAATVRSLTEFGFDIVDEEAVANEVVAAILGSMGTAQSLEPGPGVGGVRFEDTLTGFGGSAISGAVVRAFPYNTRTKAADFNDLKGSSTTAADGSYHLYLDPGTYIRRVWRNGTVLLDDIITIAAPQI